MWYNRLRALPNSLSLNKIEFMHTYRQKLHDMANNSIWLHNLC